MKNLEQIMHEKGVGNDNARNFEPEEKESWPIDPVWCRKFLIRRGIVPLHPAMKSDPEKCAKDVLQKVASKTDRYEGGREY